MAHQKNSHQAASGSQPGQGGSISQPAATNTRPQAASWTQEDKIRSSIERRNFSSDRYLRGSYLGCGGWSTVYKVYRVTDGRILAGKSSKTIQQLRQEAQVLRRLRHDHILKFIELYEEKDNEASMLLVTELCAEGTLQTRIDQADGGMSRVEVLQATVQIAEALAYLHTRNMFHSDVKPRNILIRRLNPIDVVLADCADTKEVGKSLMKPRRGTQAYWSPEMLKHCRHYGKSDDVWALGITLLGMIAQWPPLFQDKNDVDKYPRRCFDHVKGLKDLNPDNGIVEMLEQMMAWTADERILAAECSRLAKKMLSNEGDGSTQEGGDLGIKTPDGFNPISFW